MKRLTTKLKEVLAEMARSNSGEMLSTHQKARLLRGLSADTSPVASPGRREVVLAIGNILPAPAMRYAITVCQRLDAVLYVLAEDIDAANVMLDPWRRERETAGVPCSVETVRGGGTVMDFFNAHPRVDFAIAGGNGDPVTKLFGGKALVRRKPPVPIVAVENGNTDKPMHATPAGLRYALAD